MNKAQMIRSLAITIAHDIFNDIDDNNNYPIYNDIIQESIKYCKEIHYGCRNLDLICVVISKILCLQNYIHITFGFSRPSIDSHLNSIIQNFVNDANNILNISVITIISSDDDNYNVNIPVFFDVAFLVRWCKKWHYTGGFFPDSIISHLDKLQNLYINDMHNFNVYDIQDDKYQNDYFKFCCDFISINMTLININNFKFAD
jgi:hypothetical protein